MSEAASGDRLTGSHQRGQTSRIPINSRPGIIRTARARGRTGVSQEVLETRLPDVRGSPLPVLPPARTQAVIICADEEMQEAMPSGPFHPIMHCGVCGCGLFCRGWQVCTPPVTSFARHAELPAKRRARVVPSRKGR